MSGAAMPHDRLYRTIADVLGVPPDQLTDRSSPASIASWDSLNHLNVAMAIEGEFGISLSADEILEMHDVGAIRAMLAGRCVEV